MDDVTVEKITAAEQSAAEPEHQPLSERTRQKRLDIGGRIPGCAPQAAVAAIDRTQQPSILTVPPEWESVNSVTNR